jgi:glycyl-tRNA synthetase
VPFGIAQVGKSFRNEVTPRNFIFRSREFEQMEMEWFCPPDDALKWYGTGSTAASPGGARSGFPRTTCVLRAARPRRARALREERRGPTTSSTGSRSPTPGSASSRASPTGDFDLAQHQEHAVKLEYFDPQTQERYLPHVIEPASGLTRGVLACCARRTRSITRPSPSSCAFHPRLAPIKCRDLPAGGQGRDAGDRREALPRGALAGSRPSSTPSSRSASATRAWTRRARRSASRSTARPSRTQTVTVRDRDTGAQERIALDAVSRYLAERLL